MEIYLKVSGVQTKNMVLAHYFIIRKMKNTLDNLTMAKNMGKVFFTMQMGINISVNGKIMKNRVMVGLNIQQVQYLKEIGSEIKLMAKEYYNLLMAIYFMEILLMVLNKVKENMYIVMVRFMKVIGLMMKKMDKVSAFIQMVTNMLEIFTLM